MACIIIKQACSASVPKVLLDSVVVVFFFLAYCNSALINIALHFYMPGTVPQSLQQKYMQEPMFSTA